MKRAWILTNRETSPTTAMILDEFRQRGWEATPVNPLSLALRFPPLGENIQVLPPPELKMPDLVCTRLGSVSPFQTIGIVRVLEHLGLPVVNSSASLLKAKDKQSQAAALHSAGVPIPSTLYCGQLIDAAALMAGDSLPPGPPWVLKVPQGSKGKGVVLVDSAVSLESTIDAFAALGSPVIIQEFLKTEPVSDIRILVVAGQPIAAVRRVAKRQDFRANIHSGGSVEPFQLSAEIIEMAKKAVECLGLFIAGVDIVETSKGLFVLEVNTAPGLNSFKRLGMPEVVSTIVDRIQGIL